LTATLALRVATCSEHLVASAACLCLRHTDCGANPLRMMLGWAMVVFQRVDPERAGGVGVKANLTGRYRAE